MQFISRAGVYDYHAILHTFVVKALISGLYFKLCSSRPYYLLVLLHLNMQPGSSVTQAYVVCVQTSKG